MHAKHHIGASKAMRQAPTTTPEPEPESAQQQQQQPNSSAESHRVLQLISSSTSFHWDSTATLAWTSSHLLSNPSLCSLQPVSTVARRCNGSRPHPPSNMNCWHVTGCAGSTTSCSGSTTSCPGSTTSCAGSTIFYFLSIYCGGAVQAVQLLRATCDRWPELRCCPGRQQV